MSSLILIKKFLKEHQLILTTAESCTAGKIIFLLASIEGIGKYLDIGYITYSAGAKKRVLQVSQDTIDKFTLSSEEVAKEMVLGAFKKSIANIVIATTGVAGNKKMEGTPSGTVCFAWGFRLNKKITLFTNTKHFNGTRKQIIKEAATYALLQVIPYFTKANNPEIKNNN